MLHALFEIQHVIRVVDPRYLIGPLLNTLSEFVKLELLSLLKFHFKQGNLILKVRDYQIVPSVGHLPDLLLMNLLQSNHFV